MAPRRDPQPGTVMPPSANAGGGSPMPATPGGSSPLSNDPNGTVKVPQTFDAPPTGVDDNTLAQWLQQHADALDDTLATLGTQYDNALADLDSAQASQDPVAIGAARAKVQAAQRQVSQAQSQQDRYLRQLNTVQDRIAKQTLTPEQKATYEAQKAEIESRIQANKAAQALDQARLDKEFNPDTVKADAAVKAAQAKADEANANYTNARAATVAAESAANVNQSNASANASNAQAGRTNAEVAAGLPGAQAAQTTAQANAANAATAVDTEKLHQAQIGDLATLREQLDKGVQAWTSSGGKSGTSPQDARNIYQAAVDKLATGADAYTRQNQTAQNRLSFARDAMQQGALVNTNQRYIPGGEPGGFYQSVDAAMGLQPGDYSLQGTVPIPAAVQSLGADVTQPYSQGHVGPPPQFGPQPQQAGQQAVSPAVASLVDPNATGTTRAQALATPDYRQPPGNQIGNQSNGQPSPAVQSLGMRAPNDWRGLDGKQVLAAVRALAQNPAATVAGAGG